MLERLIYQSRAVGPTPETAAPEILDASVWHNAKLQITGALGFADGTYVQLLEGPPDSLDRLMAKLGADTRHTEIEVLYRVHTFTRVLPGWSMALVDLAEEAPHVLPLLSANDGLALTNLLTNLAGTDLFRAA